mmetsp:Transcript_15877/g.43921  ORF Transcript_15877/g.43921 Transcript_15877/m.43921 type:complete len:1174 (+) Transcript_15877:74-3595(+)
MATVTFFSYCQTVPWRLLIGILLLLSAIPQQPRSRGVLPVVNAFVGPGRTTSPKGFRVFGGKGDNRSRGNAIIMRSFIASKNHAAYSATRRRFQSSPFLSSSFLDLNPNSRNTQMGALPGIHPSDPLTPWKMKPRLFVEVRKSTVGITSRIGSRLLSSSNAPPLHSTASATVVEEDSSNATPALEEIETKNNKTMFFAEQAPPSSTVNAMNGDKDESELFHGLKSRPIEGGNWDPNASLAWTKDFGRRCPEYEKRCRDGKSFTKLKPGDEGYFDVSDIDARISNATIVRTKEQARIVMEKLMNSDPSIFHACDTEVMDIELKEVGPVGNGYVTCLSVYSGPDFDYGLGAPLGSTLWIDNLDDAHGILQEFKPWMEDERFKKIWHNYGFDRHVMWNEGIDCKGFGGDTMHMARLQDTSRMKNGGGGYSLEALTSELLGLRKRPMKEIFGVPRIKKDGTPGSILDVPPIGVLQRDPRFRENFIAYSCYDAVGTWRLHQRLVQLLKGMDWISKDTNLYDYYWANMREFGEVLTDMERRGVRVDAKDYLASVEKQARQDREDHLNKFRQWVATEIGPDGLAINPASSLQLCTLLFGGSENVKTKERTEAIRVFKIPIEEIPADALEAYTKLEEEKRKQMEDEGTAVETDHLDQMTAVQLKALCRECGLKVSGKKADLQQRLREHLLLNPINEVEDDEFDQMSDDDLRQSLIARNLDDKGDRQELLNRLRDDIQYMHELETAVAPDALGHISIIEALEAAARDGGVVEEILQSIKEKSMAKPKFMDVTVRSLGMEAIKHTAGGAPSVTADVLRKLAGDPFEDPPKYGTAYEFFGSNERGHEACVALYSLCAIGSIDTMIANFLTSLQSLADHQSRVHCSLNLNTETGRLSSRRPNLQNQPALEKDKYKIRQAFQASPGNSLIVADYGQLELRLLASMTHCKSMIDAFESGGDFHSRTALDMFDHVKQKVDEGEVLLEWDYSKGDPPKPLLKDEFASERRKAKTLNFSIAYGKTAHGLSQDWGVTQKEAQDMLDKWYNARPEVRKWQVNTKAYARTFGLTRTLMGRYRQLPEATGRNKRFVGHAERASINTPIQGGAADVAMMAMVKINKSEKLKRLGWILLLQVHDEVMLEGPDETAEEAFEEVIQCMESPWVLGLAKTAVPLLVDGSWKHKNWYDAK